MEGFEMTRKMKINERSLIEGLSYALDVAEKNYFSHAKHVAYMAFMLAKELPLSKEKQKDIYYAALLHDIGASNSPSIEDHCIAGSEISKNLPLNNIISEYILYHHEYVNGTGPFHLKREAIPLPSQIICLADLFDSSFRNLKNLNSAAFIEMKGWIQDIHALFAPELLLSLQKLIEKEYILLDYFNHEFNTILSKRVDIQESELDWEGAKAFAYAFSEIIDKRSPFTYRHSAGIANLTLKITKGLGYDDEVQEKMYVAALLHDVGKLAISNDIIDKKGKLNEQERYEINKHTYYTRWILEQIDGFEEITEYASNHHEKLNGRGYPLHLSGDKIGELERIMTICDIY
ncbi:HD-GYP domain-containing protein [Bacillus benzoevorans]|uniref:Putative nucleotidyltransferase with HDIG domain n=1 Tax=Bacillus benzoevorans TaxID=1456 RepID=A0A7X0HWD2_9BACI|nr:HD domain-containing phosphohydrolase [Bacillus benzoevorans]MBB6446811.1 putative nucleotidyltransferase with HDIG domain [Bacillus benzoevorans]